MALVAPNSIGSTTNPPSGSTLIKQSGGTFIIKMWGVNSHYWTKYEEITGDGDANPVFAHNQQLYGRLRVSGACVEGVEIGIQQLKGSSNPGTFIFLRSSDANDGKEITVTALVTDLSYEWRRGRVYVPLTLDLIVTTTDPAAIETT